jgi:hypothetical protein
VLACDSAALALGMLRLSSAVRPYPSPLAVLHVYVAVNAVVGGIVARLQVEAGQASAAAVDRQPRFVNTGGRVRWIAPTHML